MGKMKELATNLYRVRFQEEGAFPHEVEEVHLYGDSMTFITEMLEELGCTVLSVVLVEGDGI